MMKKFEYKVFDIDELDQPEKDFLNKMGLEKPKKHYYQM